MEVRRGREGPGVEVRCQVDNAGADLSRGTQCSGRSRCGGTQSRRRTRCGSAQFRHRRAADIRRFILVKLQTFLEIIIGCLLSIAAEFWVSITGIAFLVTAF